jgi:hypothetical protein
MKNKPDPSWLLFALSLVLFACAAVLPGTPQTDRDCAIKVADEVPQGCWYE